MAILTHEGKYPCGFVLRLLDWERYNSARREPEVRNVVPLGEPYTLWVKYRMALQVGDTTIYESQKDTTLVLEDIERLIQELDRLANGKTNAVGFDPIEPDFGLAIRNLTESEASVSLSSAAEIRAGVPTGAVNESDDPAPLFDAQVWIDHPNQVDRFYGGYGPGLYFQAEVADVERFTQELREELKGLGPYFKGNQTTSKNGSKNEDPSHL
ncbi:MAG TPA: hypothetical protein PLM79_15805 [Syntrophobacteraceae bacterium]|nr:hypothetical protein [Syntrophobacteraceae bacterium]